VAGECLANASGPARRVAERSTSATMIAAQRLGMFVTWLKHTPSDADVLPAGPGLPAVRSPGRINRILAAVRGFLL
jgi:hypothetical protein